MIEINYKLADGAELTCAVEFKDFSANVSMYVGGTATIRETTWSGRMLEETTSCQVSFANARYNAVAVNGIDLYDPPAAFLDHLEHRHRSFDDEGDCWLDTKPCPALQLSREDKVRIEDLANAVHRRYRDDVRGGRKSLNDVSKDDWTMAYDWLVENEDLIGQYKLRTKDGRMSAFVLEPIPESERADGCFVSRWAELPAGIVASLVDRYPVQLGREKEASCR